MTVNSKKIFWEMVNSIFVKLVDSKNHNIKWMSRMTSVKSTIVPDYLTAIFKKREFTDQQTNICRFFCS